MMLCEFSFVCSCTCVLVVQEGLRLEGHVLSLLDPKVPAFVMYVLLKKQFHRRHKLFIDQWNREVQSVGLWSPRGYWEGCVEKILVKRTNVCTCPACMHRTRTATVEELPKHRGIRLGRVALPRVWNGE